MLTRLAAAWVYDRRQHDRENARQRNYWDLYIGEICAQMGLTVDATSPEELEQPLVPARYSCLLLGGLEPERLSPEVKQALERWVRRGGLLIGLNTRGLDDVFGIAEGDGPVAVPDDPFVQSAYLTLTDSPLCRGIEPHLHSDKPLITFGDLRSVRAVDAEVAALLSRVDGAAPSSPAVTLRRLGEGWAAYFAFALPHTVWALHQGRPVDRDWDGDGYFRTGDSFIIGDNEIEVPYADHLVWLLENIVALLPQPLLYTMPPVDDGVPAALFYWVGDDEAQAGAQVAASDFMHRLGLPYHLNIMYKDGEFAFTREEADTFTANGHDFSLHYNFVPASGFRSGTDFSAADVREQADAYHEWFGVRPYANVNHWLRWVGWAEPARWMMEVGGRGDGSFVHARMPPLNPVNMFGFPFGTSFPFRFYDDWRRGNEMIEFVEKPITGYELGYNSESTDFTQLHRLLEMTRAQHLLTSLFYHSTIIAGVATARAAIEEVLRYTRDAGMVVKHMSLNGLVRWWLDRLASAIGSVALGSGGMSVSLAVRAPEGVVVRLPLGDRRVTGVSCDGAPATAEVWRERGQAWLMVPVYEGNHRLDITWEAAAS